MPTPRTLGVTLLCALTATLAAPGAARAAEAPPNGVSFEIVGVGGTGCLPGTTTGSVSDSGDTLTLQHDSFAAAVGVGTGPSDFRKNCLISLRIHAPAGYSYAITGTDHRGSISLAAGANAVQRTSYHFTGQAQTALVTHQFRGPVSDDWQTSDQITIASLVFSPCGAERNLNVNTDVTVLAGTSNPATTTSSMTVAETATDLYHLTWRRCA
jgi:hypothetical protein